jgi:hypothetical protein
MLTPSEREKPVKCFSRSRVVGMSETVDDPEWLTPADEPGSEQIQIVGEWDSDDEELTLYDVERPRSTTHWMTVQTPEVMVSTEDMQ